MKLLLKKSDTGAHDKKQMWLPAVHLRHRFFMAAHPCVAVFMFGAADSSAILRQMPQRNPADAPPESRGTTRIRSTPMESF